MNDKLLISVIVPIYKVEKYLRYCIESIIHQTYRNLEIILVDDGSPDNCGQICDEYAKIDNRIIVIHKENGGLSDARNAGTAIAKGDLIGYVDSDDWIALDMYENLYKLMLENNADIVVCGADKTDGKSIERRHWTNNIEVYDTEQALNVLCESGKIQSHAWDKLYKREVIVDEPFPKGKYYEDVFMMHRVFLRANKVVYVDTPYYYYRQREGSIISANTVKSNFDLIEGYKLRRKELAEENKTALLWTDAWVFFSIVVTFRTLSKIKGYKLDKTKRQEYIGDLRTLPKQAIKLRGKLVRLDRFILAHFYGLYKPYRNTINWLKKGTLKKTIRKFLHNGKRLLNSLTHKKPKVSAEVIKNKDKKKIVLIGGPEYNNLGDHAIAYATQCFVKQNSSFPYYEVTERAFESNIKKLKKIITPQDIILLQGGGNLGDVYCDQQRIRAKAIETFRTNKIIIMPQTVYFTDTPKGKAEYDKTYKLYRGHGNVTLFCRESYSYQIAQEKFADIKSYLVPDIVLSLSVNTDMKRENKCCLCLRNDNEGVLELSEKDYIKRVCTSRFEDVDEIDTCTDYPVSAVQRETELNSCFDKIASSSLLITDRLHGVIFAAITGTPCVAIGNFNHKIIGICKWLEEYPFIALCKNAFDIDKIIEMLPKNGQRIDLKEKFKSLTEELKETV